MPTADIGARLLRRRFGSLPLGRILLTIDLTIVAQKPKLLDYNLAMRTNLARVLTVPLDRVSVKATTTEKLGFEGREEGISAMCVALLER